jgi:hypothetical protein
VDAAQSFWRVWVIEDDASHQVALGATAIGSSRRMLRQLHGWARLQYGRLLARTRRTQAKLIEAPRQWMIGGAMVGGLFLLLANARRLWQAILRHQALSRPGKNPRLAAQIWYEKMTRTLARKGWRKVPGQTPGEFAGLIADFELKTRVEKFTLYYERARFGGLDDGKLLQELYEELAACTRR